MSKPSVPVHVAVAVIVNKKNEIGISFRHADSHQGSLWEFPGGKVESHETIEQTLVREIKEELNLDIKKSRPLISISHNYPDKKVILHVNKVLAYNGQAMSAEGQRVKWVSVNQLSSYKFPAANNPILTAIQLPEKYLITGKFSDEKDFLVKLKNALNKKIKLVQLRLKQGGIDEEKVSSLVRKAALLCSKNNAKLLFNIPNSYLQKIDLSNIEFDGFHVDSKTLNLLPQRPRGKLFSASCHNADELLKAKQLNADFIVLSPVQKTASHPELSAMGWHKFSSLLDSCTMPVYALGGVSENDLQKSWRHGAQGVAAISAFWG